MSDEKPIIPRGQPPLGRKKQEIEETTHFKFALLESHHKHLMSQSAALNISAAEYLRRLIEQDMERPKAQGE